MCDQPPSRTTNIYGLPLEKCQNDLRDKSGSWDANGKCSDRGENDPGVHQICLVLDDKTKNFSGLTGQSNWSASRKGRPHCVCVGAWSLYKTRQRTPEKTISANNIPVTPSMNELKCSAIPETALSEQYLRNWQTWNNHEKKFDLSKNYKFAMDALVEQCLDQAPSTAARAHLLSLVECL